MFLSFSVKAYAMTPTLSLAGTGDGDSVQVNVTGDPNSSVLLVYIKSGAGQQIASIGTTNTSGTLATTISSSSYGIPSGSLVYVVLGSITNGPQSSNVAWPAVAAMLSASNMLTLSQTGLVLTLSQSTTVTATNLNLSSLFQSSNSNPQIANFSIGGSQITVVANSYGSTTGTFCLINNISNCGSIYVIVQNGSAQPLTFSQSSITLSSGQTVTVQISGGSGSYSVLNNSSQNNGTVATSISSGTITLTTGSTTGSSSITVCSTNMTACGIINVTIGNSNSTTAVSFSQPNPTVTIGQNLNISIYGPSSSLFYVSSNSNPSIVQPNLSGTTLTLLGIANGSSTISVCASANNCGSLTVTISPSSGNNAGHIMLSQDNVSLSVGQSLNITVSGGSMPYTTLLTPNNIFQATLNSNILSIYGIGAGSSSMSVCSNGSCVSVSVNVTGTGQNYTTTPVVSVPTDCTGAVYSISTGQACPVSTVITTPLPTIPAIVSTPETTPTPTPTPTTTTTPTITSTVFKFTKSIKLGSKGMEVSQLQKKLKTLGYFKATITGTFGSVTEKAVKAFQKAHKLAVVGNVGPQTRALLNK